MKMMMLIYDECPMKMIAEDDGDVVDGWPSEPRRWRRQQWSLSRVRFVQKQMGFVRLRGSSQIGCSKTLC
ncbi:hypothetical protein HanIR_Chr01g0015381 [Helianthus annuus]|nr:hypothetical protein HanIR_Chr01g0015381 [Helianthus annuus]